MIVDATAAARRADPARMHEWLAEQRVFISSAMRDTAAERRAVREVVEEMGSAGGVVRGVRPRRRR
jgi:hypothetical protein